MDDNANKTTEGTQPAGRRDFIKTAAATTAGVVAGAVASGPAEAKQAAKSGQPAALGADQIVVYVPKGDMDKVKLQEDTDYSKHAQVTVRVSSKRRPATTPVVGVIIK